MKKIAAVLLSVLVLLAALSGCAGRPETRNTGKAETETAVATAPSGSAPHTETEGAADTETETQEPSGKPEETQTPAYDDGVWGASEPDAAGSGDGAGGLDASKGSVFTYYDKKAEPAECAPEADGGLEMPGSGGCGAQAEAGTLSAGEIKDILDRTHWAGLLSEENWTAFAAKRALYTAGSVEVLVTNGGNAVFNTKAELIDAQGSPVWTAVTDVCGRALLFAGITGNGIDLSACKVKVGDAVYDIPSGNSISVEAEDSGLDVTQLDLMFMVDTTGSMGDELNYLKAELADVVSRVGAADENIDIRTSVNFYRDEGDEYVVKYFDFRADVEECVRQIGEQYAMGGGDYPEAVHKALENAITAHRWRADAVKLCFLVLDAPPHDESEIQGINAEISRLLTAAAEQGIRIIPVASSGVDAETEFLLRSFAFVTGGSYLFLTGDSGIGGTHLEPSDTQYDVEPLNECIIRVIYGNCGLTYEKTCYQPKTIPVETAENGGPPEEGLPVETIPVLDG